MKISNNIYHNSNIASFINLKMHKNFLGILQDYLHKMIHNLYLPLFFKVFSFSAVQSLSTNANSDFILSLPSNQQLDEHVYMYTVPMSRPIKDTFNFIK